MKWLITLCLCKIFYPVSFNKALNFKPQCESDILQFTEYRHENSTFTVNRYHLRTANHTVSEQFFPLFATHSCIMALFAFQCPRPLKLDPLTWKQSGKCSFRSLRYSCQHLVRKASQAKLVWQCSSTSLGMKHWSCTTHSCTTIQAMTKTLRQIPIENCLPQRHVLYERYQF